MYNSVSQFNRFALLTESLTKVWINSKCCGARVKNIALYFY